MKQNFSTSSGTCLFHLFLILPLVVADLNSDKQALLNFSAAFRNTLKINWNHSSPVCTSWVGITCNLKKTRVIAIHLPGLGLSGSIPPHSIGNLTALRILSLRSNNLRGSLPSDLASIPSLRFLYLQHNNFAGIFPPPNSRQLTVLDLSFNSFNGLIPPELQNLTQLIELNFQHNRFSGALPDLNLSKLKFMNLSYNNLNGSVPYSLQNFPISSFAGNSLCGPPLKDCSGTSSSSSAPPTFPPKKKAGSSKKLATRSTMAAAIVGPAILLLLICMIFIFCFKSNEESSSLKGKISRGRKGKKYGEFGSGVQEAEKNKLFFFQGCSYNFDLEDLLRASAEVLGKGRFGATYRAMLEDGTTVAVKRLKEVAVGKREFEQQMEFVARVAHHPNILPNILPLLAYYYSKDEKLLVYNYMPAGSLFSLLHGNRGGRRIPLNWDSRVKIMLGTARGIAHIHSEGDKYTHGNIKSSNVLLTQDHEGCISDIGLTRLLDLTPAMSRAIGYHAPEVVQTRKLTHKSDVYSFGVLLLEVLTGRVPLQYFGQEDAIDLPRWVKSVVKEEWTAEVFDAELLRYQNIEEEMLSMLQIALACVAKAPETRPAMDEVVRMIDELREVGLQTKPSAEGNSSVQIP